MDGVTINTVGHVPRFSGRVTLNCFTFQKDHKVMGSHGEPPDTAPLHAGSRVRGITPKARRGKAIFGA